MLPMNIPLRRRKTEHRPHLSQAVVVRMISAPARILT